MSWPFPGHCTSFAGGWGLNLGCPWGICLGGQGAGWPLGIHCFSTDEPWSSLWGSPERVRCSRHSTRSGLACVQPCSSCQREASRW